MGSTIGGIFSILTGYGVSTAMIGSTKYLLSIANALRHE